MPDLTSLLELRDVTLTYPDGAGRLTALDSVSLRVGPGEFVAVTGPSGSGKSSLLAVAATLTTPERGTVHIDGHDVTRASRTEHARLRRERIGLVFQQPQLLASLKVHEQLEVMGHLGGGDRVSPARVALLLDRVGLGGLADRRPHELSGGQRQRVGIARALVHSPAVLLVDEPTSALDHERGAAVMDLLREITTEQQTATVVVTHDTELLGTGDRVARCVDGRLTELTAVA